MRQYPSDIAFTPAVKGIQTAKGSRASYAKVERRGWQTRVTPELTEFLAGLDMFCLGTASAAGQPYIQHRGGLPGFLKVLDDRTLGFADFGGNRQYITLGNLSENPRAFLFLIDYANSQLVKLWGSSGSWKRTPGCWTSCVTRSIRPRSGGPSCSPSKPGTSIVPSTFTSGFRSGKSSP
jgi:uncharacterized protein